MKAGFFFTKNFGLNFSYRDTSGRAKSSPSITVTNGSFHQRIFSGDFLYRPDLIGANHDSQWLFHFGIQRHELPFLAPIATAQVGVISNGLTALKGGVEYRWLRNKKLRMETILSYLHPLSSSADAGTDFKLHPKIAVDGTIGAAYNIRDNFFIGVYWNGQFHDYNFNYTDSNNTISGSQRLYSSNADLRFGVEF